MVEAIAITGIGHVSALGTGVPALGSGVASGRCGIVPLTVLGPRARAGIAAQIDGDVAIDPSLGGRFAHPLSRSERMALAVVAEACRAAGLDPDARDQAGLAIGATTGGMLETEEAYRRWRAGEDERPRFEGFTGMALSNVGAVLAQGLGIFGPRATVSTACSSGALAIVAAAELVARGDTPVAIAVGVDTLCRLTQAGFDALQALDPEPCRPFDAARRGLSLGEGAAALVLERVDRARARGARVEALLLGAGTTADAHHVTAPHPEGAGAVAALRTALAAAGVSPDAVDYVNAHGSGTQQNDECEIAALRAVFGARLPRLPISSSKSQIGHCLAAAGALEAAITVRALGDGVLPATVTLRTPDVAWRDLDLVPTAGRRAALGIAVSSSYGFGGHDVTLVLGRPEVGR